MDDFKFTREYIILIMRIRKCIESHNSSSIVLLGYQIGEEMLHYLRNVPDVDHIPFKQLSDDIGHLYPGGDFFDEKVLGECLILASKYSLADIEQKKLGRLSWENLREKALIIS